MRVQSNNCPICRIPFIALIQLKLVKKRADPNPEKKLPIIRIENLPIVRLSGADQTNNSLDISHDNVIIEEKREEPLLCTKAFELKKNYLDMFEVVTIYDAFNNSNQEIQNSSESFKIHSYRQKKLRQNIPEQNKIQANNDFVQNMSEGKLI